VPPDEREAFEARIAALEAALAERDANLAERDADLAERDAIIEELRARLDQNSRNSNLPPSSDGPGAAARGVRPAKGKGKRKRGGQKGHKGHRRALLPENRVHEVVDLFAESCERCAAALPPRSDDVRGRYQQLDLDHTGPHVTEWRRHETVCDRCGHGTLAAYDAMKIPASPFGPGLIARVASLTGVHHLSRRKAQILLREWFDIEVSLGAISSMEARASAALKAAAQEALDDVQAADVKHTDGTTWLLAGLTYSLWTLATTMTTVYRIFRNGKRETVRAMFGSLVGILVSDRTQVLTFWEMKLRQICWAHLLRRFVAFSQRAGPTGTFGRELLDCAVLVFEYWHGFENENLTREELQEWMRPLQRRFETVLERAAASGIREPSGSCKDMLAHKEALWTFVSRKGVPPTNNLAERDLRPLVIWRKLSFGCQSERGLRFVERVMTVAHTARKRGKNVLDFIVRSLAAHSNGEDAPALLAA
jgi:transposase